MDETPQITEDRLLSGKIVLHQLRRGHRAGTDAVLLAAAASSIGAKRIVDVGAASGAIGLMLGKARTDAEIVFLEQDTLLAGLCGKNIEYNGLAGRARVVCGDIFDTATMVEEGLAAGSADLVVSNPPFLEEGQARSSPDLRRRKAHTLPKDGLGRWVAFCTRILSAKGTVALIHRADKLVDCLAAMPSGFGGYRVRMVYPRHDEEAVRVIIIATRGRKSPTVVEPPLFLHGPDGAFTNEARAVHDGAWLSGL